MILFTSLPSEFPLETDLSQRPVNYRLQTDRGEAFVVIGLSLMWIALGPVFITMILEVVAEQFPAPTFWMWSRNLLIAAYFIWATFFHFGPEILAQFRTVDITIAEDQVSVVDCRLGVCDRWSEPLAGFSGVALHDLGMRKVDEENVAVASVVLVHPNPARTVPVLFRQKNRLGRKTVAKFAGQLNLPIVEDSANIDDAAAAGSIVENRAQALKVRLVYWVFIGGSLLTLAAIASHAMSTALEPGAAILALASLAVMAAIHVYASCYVTSMRRQDDTVTVTTAVPFGSRHAFHRDRAKGTSFHEGKFSTLRHDVNAPWTSLRVEGFYLPFIIDRQAEHISSEELRSMMQGR